MERVFLECRGPQALPAASRKGVASLRQTAKIPPPRQAPHNWECRKLRSSRAQRWTAREPLLHSCRPRKSSILPRSRLVSAACGEGCGKAGSDQLRLTSVPKAACLTPQKCDFKVSGVRVLLPIYRATHLPHQAPRLYSSNATCLNSKPQLQGGICWQGHACAKSLTMAAQAAGARQSALKALTVIELLGQVRSPGETCPE